MKRFRISMVDDAILFIAADRTRTEGSSMIFERSDDSGQWVTVCDIHRDNILGVEAVVRPART